MSYTAQWYRLLFYLRTVKSPLIFVYYHLIWPSRVVTDARLVKTWKTYPLSVTIFGSIVQTAALIILQPPPSQQPLPITDYLLVVRMTLLFHNFSQADPRQLHPSIVMNLVLKTIKDHRHSRSGASEIRRRVTVVCRSAAQNVVTPNRGRRHSGKGYDYYYTYIIM